MFKAPTGSASGSFSSGTTSTSPVRGKPTFGRLPAVTQRYNRVSVLQSGQTRSQRGAAHTPKPTLSDIGCEPAASSHDAVRPCSSAHPRRSQNDSILPSPTSRCVDDTHAAGPGQENCMALMPRSRRRRCVPLFPHVDPISRKNEARG